MLRAIGRKFHGGVSGYMASIEEASSDIIHEERPHCYFAPRFVWDNQSSIFSQTVKSVMRYFSLRFFQGRNFFVPSQCSD
jgi:hypothetical protein